MHIKVENMLVAKMITGCCWWVFISLSKAVHFCLQKTDILLFILEDWLVCYELYCWLVECGGFECLLVDVLRCGGWTAPWIRLLQCGLCDTCGSAFSGCDPALVAFYSVLWILTKILCNILLGTSSMVKLLWVLRIFLDILMYDCQ